MGIISIIGLIIQILRFLPDIISLVKAILDLIRGLRGTEGFDEKMFLVEFKEALKEAKNNKNTEPLEKLHLKLHKLCADADGGVCKPKSGT